MKFFLIFFLIFNFFINILSVIKEIDCFWDNYNLKLFKKFTYEELKDGLRKYDKFLSIPDEQLKELQNNIFACICPKLLGYEDQYSYYSFEDNKDLEALFKKVQSGYCIQLYHSTDYNKEVSMVYLESPDDELSDGIGCIIS